jgi:hypothetical protein
MGIVEKAKTFLLTINPGVRNVNGQEVVIITKDSWDKLIQILSEEVKG